MIVIGTRPEAIKMAPVYLESRQAFDCKLCITSQHKEMLAQVLNLFDIRPDYALDLMRPNQDLQALTQRALSGLSEVYAKSKPDLVLVHGDTTTAFAGALAAFYQKIPVAHVEAGLRTGNPAAPWPEEMNRRLTSSLATWHFVATPRARNNLLAEGVAESAIHLTGNTVVDALHEAQRRLSKDTERDATRARKFPFLLSGQPFVLVTAHRRENIGQGIENICQALDQLLNLHPGFRFVFPVHPNPGVKKRVETFWESLSPAQRGRLILTAPLDYLELVHLMTHCRFILTDSGGIQEEAPSLNKPVLILRETTERPESVEHGTALLVGTDPGKIVKEASALMTNSKRQSLVTSNQNPYGDGTAARRIVQFLRSLSEGFGLNPPLRALDSRASRPPLPVSIQ